MPPSHIDKPTYLNPVTKEKAVLLTSSEASGGAYSLFEVTLMPGGGNPIHYHYHFAEHFSPVQGDLGIHHKGKEYALSPGQELKALPLSMHRFYNPGAEPIIFRAQLTPGQPDFERFMQALFGLVRDGKTFGKAQIPYNPFYAIILLVWGDTYLSWMKYYRPLLGAGYAFAKAMGYEKKLLKTYVQTDR